MQNRLYNIFGALLIPVAWWVSDLLQIASPLLLPPFSSVVTRLFRIITNGSLGVDLGFTAYRWALGFSTGVLAGVVVGLIFGISLRLRTIFEFPIEFLRYIPVTAIFPLFLIVFGIGDPSKVAMAFTPTFLLMVVNTTYGVTLTDPK